MKEETKETRFTRIAEKRVQRVIDSLRSLSQCSNKRMYNWNSEQLNKICNAVDDAVKSCKESFEKAEPEEFKL